MTVNAAIPVHGDVFRRGESGYEDARLAAVWNAKKPDRFPEIIVVADSEEDAAATVRFARSEGLQVAIRSGGHSLSAAGIRDGGILLDLSRLRGCEVDVATSSAIIGPSIRATDLVSALAPHGLAFPVGHCATVAMGGYLLSGGFGWNMGTWGPACFSVRAIDVVTAEGRLVRADENENADLFWAARGAGSGFFGVVTRFHLALYPTPAAIATSTHLYRFEDIEGIVDWATSVAPSLPPSVEMILVVASAPPGVPAGPTGKVIVVTTTAFVDSEVHAARALSFLRESPHVERALVRIEDQASSFAALHAMIGTFLPEGMRFAEDTVWSNEPASSVLPTLARHVALAPSPGSHVLAPVIRPPGRAMPDAAFSMGGRSYFLCYAVWDDQNDDEQNETWLRRMVEDVAPFTIGRYIAENDFLADSNRAEQSFAPANWKRLRQIRVARDPEGVFHDYLGSEQNDEP